MMHTGCVLQISVVNKILIVKVYDSWRTGDVTTDVKEAITILLHSSNQRMHLLFPEVQQKDSSSCGVYALHMLIH